MFLYPKDVFDEATKPKEHNNAHNERPDDCDIVHCHY
jgi:hypothetical protein